MYDPSIISQIPNFAPNPTKAKQEAFTLSDMIDRNQLNKMTLSQEKTKMDDLNKIREILTKSDLSSFEGQQKAAEAVTKINPQMGMSLLKEFQGAQMGKQELDLSQYKILAAHNDVIAQATEPLKSMADELAAKGVPDAQINAQLMPKVLQTFQQLSQAKLPNGQPVIGDQEKQAFQQMVQGGNLRQSINSLVMQSNQAREILKTKLAERKENESERHNRTMEGLSEKRTDAQTGASLSDDAVQLAVDRLLSGEKPSNVLSNLGRGAQGAKDLRRIQNQLASTAKQRGISGPELVKIMQSTAADARAVLELGSREGKIAARVQEAQNFAKIALDASEKVDRGNFVPWNKLSQMSDTQLSDPALARLKAATVSLINAYAAAVGGGTPTVHDKEAAENMLSNAQGPEAYKAVVQQLLTETEQALDAPGQVRERMTGIKPQDAKKDVDTTKQTNAGSDIPPPPSGFVIQ